VLDQRELSRPTRYTRGVRHGDADAASQRAATHAVHARRARAALAAALLLPWATGCYTNRMIVNETMTPGTEVALSITDRGRVGLGERVGPGAMTVTGRLVGRTDSMYVLRVSSVDFINAGTSHWSGEELKVPRDYVSTVAERSFSRSRSWLMAGVVVGAIVVIAAGISLAAGGSDDGGTEPPPGGQASRRVP
jgi:hypothetical protein